MGSSEHKASRREFLQHSGVGIAATILAGDIAAENARAAEIQPLVRLQPTSLRGGLRRDSAAAPIAGAAWYEATAAGDGLQYAFEPGALAGAGWLSADLLLDGIHLAVFRLQLQEGEKGSAFVLSYGLLNQCSARLRLALESVNQNRWMYPREGAWLKPLVSGQRVDLAKVDRLTITISRKSGKPVRWCQTDVAATVEEPPLLESLVLPKGPLLDELGQSTLHDWPAKSRNAEEVIARIRGQHETAARQRWPEGFSKWGGWSAKRFEASGFFRTHNDGTRWWLVDPEGFAFWSAGMDCVRVDTAAGVGGIEKALAWMPERTGPFEAIYGMGERRRGSSINFLAANFIRAFSPETWYERWADIALGELRRCGFNTVANWSDWQIAKKAAFPYVRPLNLRCAHCQMIYRDFPDVYHPGFAEDAAAFAAQLQETKDDPAFIGYFLMNEPTWGFSGESPAAGMLFTSPKCESRKALAEFLRKRYGSDQALADAWAIPATFAAVQEGQWKTPLSPAAQTDLAGFSTVMVEKFFKDLTAACRRVDPNHLNLGIRYYTVPPAWAIPGMRCFDVFSMNCYDSRVRVCGNGQGELAAQPSGSRGGMALRRPRRGASRDGNRRGSGSGRARQGVPQVHGGRRREAVVRWGPLLHAVRSVGAGAGRRRELQHRIPGRLQSAVRPVGGRGPREPRTAVPGGIGPARTLQRPAAIPAEAVPVIRCDGPADVVRWFPRSAWERTATPLRVARLDAERRNKRVPAQSVGTRTQRRFRCENGTVPFVGVRACRRRPGIAY